MTQMLTSIAGQGDLPRWFARVFDTIAELKRGSFDFELPDGRRFSARSGAPGPAALVQVRNPALFARILREGEMGFAEAFMEGWWDTPDLQAVLDVALLNNDEVAQPHAGVALARLIERLRHWMNRNTRAGARRNIEAHYDLGNAFYAKWLDPTMTYSSALFHGRQESLETGQINKYVAICDAIAAPRDGHVLEIGCGWGGFAEYAAGTRGLRVTGLTISPSQRDFARKRMFEAGLAERVSIELRDYRDETGRYDGIASIEMLEAVGESYWPVYFRALHDRLNPEARATLQAITVADRLFARYRKSVDFVQKHIFPGGMLPSPRVLREQAAGAGLDLVDSVAFGPSYSETLRRWRTRFNACWDEIAPLGFDERFQRMWNFYLASCASCFMAGTTDVSQVTLRRAG